MRITKSTNPTLVKIAQYAFPEYHGRKYFVEYQNTIDTAYNNGACGGGGTQYYYRFIRMDGLMMEVPVIGLGDDFRKHESIIPQGCACVVHSIFCGHDCGLTVYLPTSMQIAN